MDDAQHGNRRNHPLRGWRNGGCGGSSANTPPPATASAASASDAEDANADLMEHHRYHHHGGVTLLIAMSLDTLGVSPEQRAAVERIRADLHARMEPARAADQALVALLAEGLAAAKFDTAKVDAAVGQLTVAGAAVHEASADALNELHAVLTPAERAALVDKVESHWAVWQKANADETGAATEGGHLATLATDLDLTPDQVDRIRAGLSEGLKTVPRLDPQEIATELRAFGDAISKREVRRESADHGHRRQREARWLGSGAHGALRRSRQPRAHPGPAREARATAPRACEP